MASYAGGGGGGGGGVTSVIAGTGVSVSSSTGDVTVTNTAPFAADTIISINNSAASPVSAWEGISSLTTNTAGSEASKYVVKLLAAGAQVTALDIRPTQLLLPNGALATPSHGFQNSATSGMWWDAANTRLAWTVNGGQSGTANMYLNSTDMILGYALARVFFNPNGDSVIGRNGSGQLFFTGTNGFAFGAGKLGFSGVAPVVQQTVGANVNNVVASGTTGQFDDFTSLSVYATDAPAIHADIYQLARSVAQITTALRAYGLGV